MRTAEKAQKTDEERYNEEQAAIDRETQKKLRECSRKRKLQHLPSDERKEKQSEYHRTK